METLTVRSTEKSEILHLSSHFVSPIQTQTQDPGSREGRAINGANASSKF